MNTKRSWILTVAAASVLASGGLAAWIATASQEQTVLPELPSEPTGVRSIVSAQPFVLEQPWRHMWRAEMPLVQAGWLLVLEVDPDLTRPRQGPMNVLFAGAQTVEQVNHAQDSGRLVAVLPSELGADGLPALDLAATPIWFGEPGLPEQQDAASLAAGLASARAKGIEPFPAAAIAAALARGGQRLSLEDRYALDQQAVRLIREHSPLEEELAEGLSAPRVR